METSSFYWILLMQLINLEPEIYTAKLFNEVKTATVKLKQCKSPGISLIWPEILKQVLGCIIEGLHYLVVCS
jgi:hypothetical protein